MCVCVNCLLNKLSYEGSEMGSTGPKGFMELFQGVQGGFKYVYIHFLQGLFDKKIDTLKKKIFQQGIFSTIIILFHPIFLIFCQILI